MKRLVENILPTDDKKRKWFSIGLTIVIAGLLTLWGIYGIRQYGIALFIFTPLFIGAAPTILYGRKKQVTMNRAFFSGLLTLCIFTAGLLLFAIEGLICIAMAAPIALVLTWVGSLIGYAIIKKNPGSATTAMLILIGSIPTIAFVEKAFHLL